MGDLGGAKEALQSGIHVDSLDKEGKTPLMVAAIHGHTEMISLLLDRGGAKLDLTHEKYGTTALHWACQYGHKEVVITLIRKGCNYDYLLKICHTPLSVAAYWGNSDVVSVLVSLLVKINKITAEGKTAADGLGLGVTMGWQTRYILAYSPSKAISYTKIVKYDF